MAAILTDLIVDEIAFVDEGDNPEANILVFKRRPEEPEHDGETATAEDNILKRLAAGMLKALGYSDIDAEKKNRAAENGADPNKKPEPNDEPEKTFGSKEGELQKENENKSAEKSTDKIKQSDPGEKKSRAEKGDFMDMSRIDLSKLTDEERAQLEAIKNKALIDDPEDNSDDKKKGTRETEKNNGGKDDGKSGSGSVCKEMHPAVKAELEELRKLRSEIEDKELLNVAKRYEIIGRKPEELVKTFKSLKAAGGEAYEEMIAVLDSAVETVNGAGVFGEIGKRGGTDIADDAEKAWAKIEKFGEEIRKLKPELTPAQAMDEAARQHPELVHEYEENM